MPARTNDTATTETISDLNKKAELPANLQSSSPRALVKSASKVFQAAKDSEILGEEGKAYTLYMKFLNLAQVIRKSVDYRKDKPYFDSLIGKEMLKALQAAEILQEKIQNRLDELEAERLAAVTSSESLPDVPADELDDFLATISSNGSISKTTTTDSTPPAVEPVSLSPTISPVELFPLMQATSNDGPLLIDIRTTQEHSQSQMKLPGNTLDIIWIPQEKITPGTLCKQIRSWLSPLDQNVFDARSNYRRVILFDSESKYTELTATSAITVIKDALYKWEQQVRLASEPQVLDGGYQEWLRYYPQHSTNAAVLNRQTTRILNVPKIDTLSFYPDMDAYDSDSDSDPAEDFPPSRQTPIESSSRPQPAPRNIPSFNRAAKPVTYQQPAIPSQNTQPGGTTSNMTNPAHSGSTLSSSNMNNGAWNGNSLPISNGRAAPHTAGVAPVSDQPQFNRALKPGQTPVTNFNQISSEAIRQQELAIKLSAQNQKIISETGDRLRQLNADREQVARLSELREAESKNIADLMRKSRELEEQIKRQEEKLNTAKQVQRDHQTANSSTPLVDRSKKPDSSNLEDWEQKLSELSVDEKNESAGDKNGVAAGQSGKENKRTELKSINFNEEVRKEQDQAKQAELKRQKEAALLKQQEKDQAQKEAEFRKQELEKAQQEAELKKQEQIKKEANLKKQEQARKEAELREQARKEAELREQARKEAELKEQEQARKEAEQARKDQQFREQERARKEAKLREEARKEAELRKVEEEQRKKLEAERKQSERFGRDSRTTTRLKSDETTFGVDGEISSSLHSSKKSSLKKFSSQPNLANLDDSDTLTSGSQQQVVNRSLKPSVTDASRELDRQKQIFKSRIAESNSRRLNSLSAVYGKTNPGMTGLYNMGNTCYMNSTLQCLSHTPALCRFFLDSYNYTDLINTQSDKGSRGLIAQELAFLMSILWNGNYQYVVPKDFKSSFGRVHDSFDHFRQMDSQEFLGALLDTLHEDLNSKGHVKVANPPTPSNSSLSERAMAEQFIAHRKKTDESIISLLFSGIEKSMTTCRNCGKNLVRFEATNTLTVQIQSSRRTSLQDCLKSYLSPEKAEDYRCEKCGRTHTSYNQRYLWKLPDVLIILFKRFVHTSNYGQWTKKTNMIDFPDLLRLDEDCDGKTKDYHLYGVVNHYGSLDSGHYTSFCKNVMSGRWHKFNDETVSSLSSSDVKSSAAYVLFYTSHTVKSSR